MKKIIALFLTLCMTAALFVGCAETKDPDPTTVPAEATVPETTEAVTEATTEAAEATEAPKDEMVGNTLIPTQEEALAQMGLTEVPQKILCATYNTTIMAYNLGVELSGRVESKRPIPEEILDVPTIGVVRGSSNFDFEKIIALAGDLVLSDESFRAKLEPTLDEQGIPSYFVDTKDFNALKDTLALLGAAFGKRDQVISLLENWEADIAQMQAAIEGKESPVVVILRKAENMATKNSYVGSLFDVLNITSATDLMDLGDDVPAYVPIDIEKIIAVNPDYILIPGAEELEGDIAFMEEVKTSPAWSVLDAVKEGRVLPLTDTYYQPIADMGCIDALHELFDILYK